MARWSCPRGWVACVCVCVCMPTHTLFHLRGFSDAWVSVKCTSRRGDPHTKAQVNGDMRGPLVVTGDPFILDLLCFWSQDARA